MPHPILNKKNAARLAKLTAALALLPVIALSVIALSPELDDTQDTLTLEVSQSHADLTWLDGAPLTPTQRFGQALDELGHEPPRLYDLNDNEIFFSTRVVRQKHPRDILAEYQRKFVEVGINSREYTEPAHIYASMDNEAAATRTDEMVEAAMSGEILPTQVGDSYLSMNGALMEKVVEQVDTNTLLAAQTERMKRYDRLFKTAYLQCGGDEARLEHAIARARQEQDSSGKLAAALQKNKGENGCSDAGGTCSEERYTYQHLRQNLTALMEVLREQPEVSECPMVKAFKLGMLQDSSDDFAARVKGMRSIEAFYDQKSGSSVVTAVWTKNDLDLSKLDPERHGYPEDGLVRGDLPVCDTCQRAWSLGGNGEEEAFTSNIVWSKDSVERTVGAYRQLMHEQGWVEAGAETTEPLIGQLVGTPDSLEGYNLRFEKGGAYMTLGFRKDESGRTEVMGVTSD